MTLQCTRKQSDRQAWHRKCLRNKIRYACTIQELLVHLFCCTEAELRCHGATLSEENVLLLEQLQRLASRTIYKALQGLPREADWTLLKAGLDPRKSDYLEVW